VATAIAHLAMGALFLAEGHADEALQYLGRAATLTRTTQPIHRPLVLLTLSRARAMSGDLAGALASAAEARELIEGSVEPEVMSVRLRSVERQIARETALQTDEPMPTLAELRVLRLLPTSLSQREIARELYLSPDTVKTHVRRLYRKLEAGSREEAVERARSAGLL
jgi:LuxR family maltose regulon positive regulatory protein